MDGRPGDRRNFVHKRIFGAIGGAAGALLSGGNPITGAIGGFGRGGRSSAPAPPIRGRPIRPTRVEEALGLVGNQLFSASCEPGFFRDRNGICQPLLTPKVPGIVAGIQRLVPGGETGFQEFGAAVMGQFGAALEPGIRTMDTRVCPRGTVLGVDGLCYNHRDIKNSERAWPRGRRPLLTGGDMRCISVAASAAKKLERKTKQLQSLGMMKKPAPRRRALPSGHHAHVAHDGD